ncbi:methyltransferase family protein [Rhizobium tumorigenes]|uniref:Isoprenylcysteine carboxylmethyltransferase family protein n=1 Tax=Rhizobium tumorigenes TaxID=2041385 RepID=A0AAF1K6U6_9HYPH|nr:isoprenylcysteine carboxylmethyltransferase family protein [Rhizobium tumorigenes]WFR96890.1 isoprenylcysteine carboxylmethyltransferase family protein [Rhizobium tumorigenes]
MNAYRAKPLSFPWPPFIYGLAIITALVADAVIQIPIPGLRSPYFWTLGAALTLLAVWLDLWAMKTLLDRRATVMPHRRSVHLMTTGPFRYTRNPIYLGYTLVTVGSALLTGNPWLLVAALAATVATDYGAIRHEELHLLSRFGCEFEFYCRHTRRWL